MLLTKWRPLDRSIQRWTPFTGGNFDRICEDFFQDLPEISPSFSPPLDLYDDKDAYVVKLEIPGMKKEEIDISINENILTVKGERKLEKREEKDDYYEIERRYGSFSRSLEIPSEVKPEEVKASYTDGILEIRVPKVEKKEPRRIEISAQ